jgi:hypothetical protein
MLALTYLAVQYQLALHKAGFIVVLALAAVIQPATMIAIGGEELTTVALGLLGINAALAVVVVTLAFRAVGRAGEIPEDELPPGTLTGAGVSSSGA